jgi:glycosyltransferase involved in cell wall biosynthesis
MTTPLIVLSTADWDAPLWTNKQHLASRLAQAGLEVLYVDSLGLRQPSSASEDRARIWRRLRGWRPFGASVHGGLWRDAPLLIPFPRLPLVRTVNRTLIRLRLRRNVLHLWGSGRRPVVWSFTPYGSDYSPKGWPLVYHCVDDLATYPGVATAEYIAAERATVERAKRVIVSSKPLQDLLSQRTSHSATIDVWQNVADVEAFSPSRRDLRSAGEVTRVGFLGAIQSHKVDTHLLDQLAAKRHEWVLDLGGPVGIGMVNDPLLAHKWAPNVSLQGAIPKEDRDLFLANLDVALIPYLNNEYTAGVFPMKLFEYLAAGLPIVATPMRSILESDDWPELAAHVSIAESADEAIEQIERLVAADRADPQLRYVRSALASRHGWANRAMRARELVRQLADGSD